MKLLQIAGFCLFFLFAWSGQGFAQPNILGKITYLNSGAPAPNCKIMVRSLAGDSIENPFGYFSTDSNGEFTFPGSQPLKGADTFSLSIASQEYEIISSFGDYSGIIFPLTKSQPMHLVICNRRERLQTTKSIYKTLNKELENVYLRQIDLIRARNESPTKEAEELENLGQIWTDIFEVLWDIADQITRNDHSKAGPAFKESLKLLKVGKFAEARILLSEYDGQYPEAFSLKAQLATVNFDFETAEKCYEKAFKLSPYDPVILLNLSDLFAFQHQEEEGVEYFLEVMRASSTDQDWALTRICSGKLYLHEKENLVAQRVFSDAIRSYSNLELANPWKYTHWLALSFFYSGKAFEEKFYAEQAHQSWSIALDLYAYLAKIDPFQFGDKVAEINHLLAVNFTNTVDYDEKFEPVKKKKLPLAKIHLAQTLKIYREFYSENPGKYARLLGEAYQTQAYISLGMEEIGACLENIIEAKKYFKNLKEMAPIRNIWMEADVNFMLAHAFGTRKDNSAVEKDLTKVITTLDSLAPLNPRFFKPRLVNCWRTLANHHQSRQDFSKAEIAYTQALRETKYLAEQEPGKYDPLFWGVSQQMVWMYHAALDSTLDIFWKPGAVQIINAMRQSIEKNLSRDDVWVYRQFVEDKTEYFENLTQESLIGNSVGSKYQRLTWKTDYEATPEEKVKYQTDGVVYLKAAREEFPENAQVRSNLALAYGNLAWFQVLNQDYPSAEKAAREGLSVDPEAIWINSNLALALLFQNKFTQAKALYKSLKNKKVDSERTFKQVFLSDFDALQADGISHPDIPKIKKQLKN